MQSDLVLFWNTLGGPAQGVVILLGLMSLASVAVVVERGTGLFISARDSRRFVPLAQAALQSGLLAEIIPLAEKCSLSPEAELIQRSGIDLEATHMAEWEANRRLLLARWSVDRTLASLNLDLRRGLPIVGTIAATSPFVGLMGTVLGIIRAFDSLGRAGTGLAGVSQGVAEALVTTALGLFVAIPAAWAYNFFTDKVDIFIFQARRFSTVLLEALAAGGGASTLKILSHEPEHVPGALRVSRTEVLSNINVTPLVDVVLVLLIIFMVVMPAPQSALELGFSRVVRSEAGNKQEKKERVFVRVSAANEVYLNDREIPPGSLKDELESTFRDRTGEPLFFEADPAADYPRVIAILDEVSAAGVKNIAVVNRERGRSPRSPSP